MDTTVRDVCQAASSSRVSGMRPATAQWLSLAELDTGTSATLPLSGCVWGVLLRVRR